MKLTALLAEGAADSRHGAVPTALSFKREDLSNSLKERKQRSKAGHSRETAAATATKGGGREEDSGGCSPSVAEKNILEDTRSYKHKICTDLSAAAALHHSPWANSLLTGLLRYIWVPWVTVCPAAFPHFPGEARQDYTESISSTTSKVGR